MPYEKMKYCCNHCHVEYGDYNDAMNCENNGLPIDPDEVKLGETKLGETVSFEEENTMFGTRYSYSSNNGTVVAKILDLDDAGNHVWRLVVETDVCERVVGILESDMGKRLTSPHEWAYKKGFHQHIKERYHNINQ